MRRLMGVREYARYRKVSHTAVQKAIDTKRISYTVGRDGRKQIDADRADQEWKANTDFSHAPAAASSPAPSDNLEDLPPVVDEVSKKYRDSRASRETAQAEMAHLELEQRRGKLIDLDEAKRIAYTTFRGIRDQLQVIPVRIKDVLSAETDPMICEAIVEREIQTVLSNVNVRALLTEQEDREGD